MAVLQADAAKQTAVKRAEGEKEAAVLEGDGTKARLLAQAAGDAAVIEQKLTAEANGTRAKLLAQAEGDAAQKGKVLEAEAEGTRKLAEALEKMTDAARLIIVLDKLPNLFDHGGEAAAKMLRGIFEPSAAALAAIDSVHIVDMGGNGNGVNRMGGAVTDSVFGTIAKLQASGVDVQGLLKKAGIDVSKIIGMLGSSPTVAGKPDEVKTEELTAAKQGEAN